MGRRHHVASWKCTDGKQDNAGSIQVTIEPEHTELNTCNLLSQTGAPTQGRTAARGQAYPATRASGTGQRLHRADSSATGPGPERSQQRRRPGRQPVPSPALMTYMPRDSSWLLFGSFPEMSPLAKVECSAVSSPGRGGSSRFTPVTQDDKQRHIHACLTALDAVGWRRPPPT